jgi:serine/threonine-protein kinase RsbW
VPPRSVRYEARIENLEAILRFVADCAGELPWTGHRLPDIELVLEEVVVNVCKYAYPEGTGPVEISCEGDGTALRISITDTGVPFDILNAAEPDLSADIMERQVGGLGCFLIRSMTDGVEYRRDGDRNLLELTFLPGGKADRESVDA